MATFRILIALATKHQWKIHQMDVKNAFLNGILDEEVYMKQPEGFINQQYPFKVCKLKKALYGLKQAGRQWYQSIDNFFIQQGLSKSTADSTLYFRISDSKILLVLVYVDDILLTGNNQAWISDLKKQLANQYDMKDMHEMHYCLGVEVHRSEEFTFLSQHKYTMEILQRFNMQDSKPVDTPMESNCKLILNEEEEHVDAHLYRQLVGSLIYLTITRPDLSYAVSQVSQFMHNARSSHWKAAKRILRYIQGTSTYGLFYSTDSNIALLGYSDADWAGDVTGRKSTSGYCFSLGDSFITWSSKKQPTVSLSSTEAEYRSLTNATQEALWLRRLLIELNFSPPDVSTDLLCDNKSAIQIAKNPIFHARTKHIEIQHHFVREKCLSGEIAVAHCSTDEMVADIMTKPLSSQKFVYCREGLGVFKVDILHLRGCDELPSIKYPP